MDHFQLATANKSQETQYPNLSLSAVNALALAQDMPWEDAYRLLLKQGQRYGLLLKNKICIVNMLADAGYVRIPGFRCLKSYAELNSLLTDQYPQVKEIAVVSSSYHIPQCELLFTEAALLYAYRNGCDVPYAVTGNASFAAVGNEEYSDLSNLGADIWVMADPNY